MAKMLKVDLGQSGLHFLGAKLAEGLTLAKEVLNRDVVRDFTCYTYLPDYLKGGELLDCEFGGKIRPQPHKKGPQELAEYTEQVGRLNNLLKSGIMRFLSLGGRNLCILEGHLARKSDKFTQSVLGERIILFYGEDVYYALDHAASEQRIEQGLALSHSFLRLGFLVEDFPGDIGSKINCSVDTDFIQSLASHVVGLFVNAYDDESNIIAHKKSLALGGLEGKG